MMKEGGKIGSGLIVVVVKTMVGDGRLWKLRRCGVKELKTRDSGHYSLERRRV